MFFEVSVISGASIFSSKIAVKRKMLFFRNSSRICRLRRELLQSAAAGAGIHLRHLRRAAGASLSPRQPGRGSGASRVAEHRRPVARRLPGLARRRRPETADQAHKTRQGQKKDRDTKDAQGLRPGLQVQVPGEDHSRREIGHF